MQKQVPTPRKLVLVGAGHAHACVLRDLARTRLPGIDLTLISPDDLAPYSGMIPAYLAGHVGWHACCIDFHHLCQQAGARFLHGEVASLDCARQQLRLQDGQVVDYDLLSLNIGSTLFPASDGSVPLLPLRPLAGLQAGWEAMEQQIRQKIPQPIRQPVPQPIRQAAAGSQWHLGVTGGGTAGVESILAAQYRLQQIAPHLAIQCTLLTRGQELVPGLARRAAQSLQQILQQRQIRLETGFAAEKIAAGALHAADGRSLQLDAILWATGAQAHRWPQQSSLAVNGHGFIRIDRHLRSISHPNVFATGDCCHWDNDSHGGLPKAGVFAVRMGPVLSHNLRALLQGTATLRAYAPQRHYLVLIGTGGHHAIAARGPFSWQGRWVWRWKNRIDRRFLAQFNPRPDDPAA